MIKIYVESLSEDEEEDARYGKEERGDLIPKELRKKKVLQERIKQIINEMRDEGEKVNITDTDAKFIKERNGVIRPNYNSHIAVTEEQFIVGTELTNNASDAISALSLIKEMEENTESKPDMIVGDSGYDSLENYEGIKGKGIYPLIPDRKLVMERENKLEGERYRFHRGNFRFDREKNEYICPIGEKLICYKIKEIGKKDKKYRIYHYRTKVCKRCKYKWRCCGKGAYRYIKRDEREDIIEEVREFLSKEEGWEEYKKRMCATEPIFGILKRFLGHNYFLLRGLKKVEGEFNLMCLAWNIRKLHKLKVGWV